MKLNNILFGISSFAFLVCLILKPEPCKEGVIRGILLCGRVIIPSLFPFTVCILGLLNSSFFDFFEFLSPITKKLFSLSGKEFSYFILSLLGGYPVGAKLLSESEIPKEKASFMLNYCVNGGPAFIVSAVGLGILSSKEMGYVLLLSHILSAVILCMALGPFMPVVTAKSQKVSGINPIDNFILSTSKASETILSICGFVILFSGINAYITRSPLKSISLLLEVTNAVTYTKNIYLISFLLGFSGVCIWFQVLSAAKGIKINFYLFILARVLQGALSSLFTALFVRLFNIALPTASNGKVFSVMTSYSGYALSLSMLVLAFVFIISLQTKKYAGKIIEDMV